MKKILILSKYIAPVQEIASIRWTKLAKYLSRSEACEVTVLTDEKTFDGRGGNAFRRDPMLERDMGAFAGYHVFSDGKLLERYYALKNRYSDYAREDSGGTPSVSERKQVLYELMHDWKDHLQFRSATAYLRAHPALLDCDVLVSSYGPIWTHLVGAWIKRRRPQIRWIADYRDLLRSDATPAFTRAYRKSFARRHTASADLVTVVSEEMIPALDLPPEQKTLVLPNGFDPEEALPPKAPEKFTLLYTGTMHAEGIRRSDLTPLFSVLQESIGRGELEQKDLVLQYAGREGRLFLRQADACGLASCVEDRGLVSREEAAALRQNCAALLLSTWNTEREQGVLTGKLFEYMQSCKPILAVCTGDVPNSRVYEILRDGRLGACLETCREETREELHGCVLRAYRAWKTSGIPEYRPEEAYVRGFTHPELAKKLWQEIGKL